MRAAVEVGDPPVAELRQVTDGGAHPEQVVGADAVDRAGPDVAGDGHHGQFGRKRGQRPGGRPRAEQDGRLAAVVEDGVDRPWSPVGPGAIALSTTSYPAGSAAA